MALTQNLRVVQYGGKMVVNLAISDVNPQAVRETQASFRGQVLNEVRLRFLLGSLLAYFRG